MPKGGSTSSLLVTPYGQYGPFETFRFSPKKDRFLTGTCESFRTKFSEGIANIYKLRLESTNSGQCPDLFCEEILIESAKEESVKFPCRKWLSQKHGDCQLVREIAPLTDKKAPVQQFQYEITVTTGNFWNGGTTGTVTLTIFGELGDTGARPLISAVNDKQSPFAKGSVSVFKIESVPVGDIRRIKLEHEPASNGMGWFSEWITIRDKYMNTNYLFPVNRWLNANEDDRILGIELKPIHPSSQARIQDKHLVSCHYLVHNFENRALVLIVI